jgi:hypothetical protein
VSQRFFSGRESWVFRARAVEELCGFHTDLIAAILRPDEQVRYLLYSPLREAEGGPFGIAGGSGSHALVVTDDRIIVSRDPHHSGSNRTVRGVPFGHVFAIELGEALTLGWLVLRFAFEGRMASETIFFQSSGMELFRTAVRLIRRYGTITASVDTHAAKWKPLLAQTPSYLQSQLVPLLLEDEQPERVVHSGEQWVGRGRSARCVLPHGVYGVTDRALLITESERPDRPGALVFAVKIVSIPRQVIRGARIVSRDPSGARIATVAVELEAQAVGYRVVLALNERAADDLAQPVAACGRWSAP